LAGRTDSALPNFLSPKILLNFRLPPPRQKVGESNVQVQGYYLSKILDMEEHLLREHFLKYNLRFFWKTPGRENNCYEDISQCKARKPKVI